MSAHTAGPWKRSEYDETGGYDCMTGAFVIRGADDRLIATLDLDSYGQEHCIAATAKQLAAAEADAERIVACVNACDGVPTDALNEYGAVASDELARALQQRDELLAALKGLRFLVDVSNIRTSAKVLAKWTDAARVADTAIAKAERRTRGGVLA